MITFKKFAMAVMLIAGFQQVSADVCKLKMNQRIVDRLKNNDEVVVDKNNGAIICCILNGNVTFTGETILRCHTLNTDGFKITDDMVTIRKLEPTYGKWAYDNKAIYVDADGFVMLNLNVRNNVEGSDSRQKEAKRQFENIIKCGLVYDKLINTKIYDTHFTDKEKWQMPGISADISNITNQNIKTVPVMCAMKMNTHKYFNESLSEEDKNGIIGVILEKFAYIKPQTLLDEFCHFNFEYKINNGVNRANSGENIAKDLLCKRKILNNSHWKKIINGGNLAALEVFNIEHTERQLLLYHLFNMTVDRWCDTGGIGYINGKATVKDRSFLIYTNGAPCFSEDESMIDNGGMCCWNLYRLLAGKNISISVYFSSFVYLEALSEKHKRENICGRECVNMLCESLSLENYKDALDIVLGKVSYTNGDNRKDFKNSFEELFLMGEIRKKYSVASEKQKIFQFLSTNRNWKKQYANIEFFWLL